MPPLRRWLALALLGPLLPGGCLVQADTAGLVRARPVSPSAERPGWPRVGELRFEAGFALTSSDRRFGGLSGLWVADDGARLLAVSDRGTLWSARLVHAADGRLSGVADWRVIDLAGARGDAEALTVIGQDDLVIAYEGVHRLRRFRLDEPRAPPTAVALPAGLKPSNAGVEALAELGDGSLFALAEGIRDASGDLAAWRLDGERIERFGYVAAEGFRPTGADRLDDRIYVVERRFSVLGGFASRLVVLDVDQLVPGARLKGRELARLGATSISENFEGIAARRGADGRTLLYLVSDDNFLGLQQTLLLQFSLVER